MKTKFIDIVELIEPASRDNGFLYLLTANNTNYYVSALMGKAAVGMPTGSKFKLYYNSNAQMGMYSLERNTEE